MIAVYWLVTLNKDILSKFALLESRLMHLDKQTTKIIENNTRAVAKLDSHLDKLSDSHNESIKCLLELKGSVESGVANIKTEIAKK